VIMQADANTVAIGRTDLPAIEFTKTASPDPVPVGGVLTYTLTVTNRHSVLLSACTIIDYPASGTTPLLQDGWTTVSGDNVYTFSDSITIAVGETKVLQLRVSADVAGDLLNRAELNCFAHIAGIATVTSRAQ